MADDETIKTINKEFARYIRDIPRKDTTKQEIDTLKNQLRDILGQYQDLVSPA
jgi:hypothetical protein